MEVLSGWERALTKEVRNREVQNESCPTRTASNGVYIVISLIKVDISSLMHASDILKMCYGLPGREEHLSKRVCKLDSDHRALVLLLSRSHPAALHCFLCLLWTWVSFSCCLFTWVIKIILSITWKCCLKQFDFLIFQGKENSKAKFRYSSGNLLHISFM